MKDKEALMLQWWGMNTTSRLVGKCKRPHHCSVVFSNADTRMESGLQDAKYISSVRGSPVVQCSLTGAGRSDYKASRCSHLTQTRWTRLHGRTSLYYEVADGRESTEDQFKDQQAKKMNESLRL